MSLLVSEVLAFELESNAFKLEFWIIILYNWFMNIRTGAYPISSDERIEEIKATFALEDMPLTDRDIKTLEDIESGKITTDEAREKVIAEIKQSHSNQ